MTNFARLTKGKTRAQQVEALISVLRENLKEDKQRWPLHAEEFPPFTAFLEESLRGYVTSCPEGPVDAAIRFYATGDRMCAYACLLPPLDGGEDIRIDVFGRELLRTGISYGIDESVSMTYLTRKDYLHIFPIAVGTQPVDGEDGRVEFLFEPRPVYTIEVREGKTADFSDPRPIQLVRAGDDIYKVTPPTPGTEGSDILGKKIPCKPGKPAEVQLGYNLTWADNGTRIVTAENGAVFVRDGVPFVQTAVIRLGELKQEDKLVWIAYIDGDVPEGVKLTCTNGLVVMGEIRGAEIEAKGSVRAQKGIRGGAKIVSKGQVLAPVIEDSSVRAGKSIFANVIRNSEVICEDCVYALEGKGLVTGGSVQAQNQVECIQLGGEGPTQVRLGYSQDLLDEIARLSQELNEAKSTMEVLLKHIMKLRMAGSALSSDNRQLLAQLVEQKELYERRIDELTPDLQEARNMRIDNRNSAIVCQSMQPPVTVLIGDRTGEFRYPETNCRVRLYAGQVISK